MNNVMVYQPSVVSTEDIGEGTIISSFCYIEKDVSIGKNCKIKPGCFIFDGAIIGNNVFVGPGTYMFNDRKPPSKGRHWGRVIIGDNVSIGGGCKIAPGVKVGEGAKIRMGTNVVRNVGPGEYYRGD